MAITYERRRLTADAIFAVEDRYARGRVAGVPHPGPLGRVVFRVLGQRVGGSLRSFPERTELRLQHTDTGFAGFFREVTVEDGDSVVRRQRLLDGTYVVQIETDAYQQPAEFDLTLPHPTPATPIAIDLDPGYAYPFRNASPLRQAIAPLACTATAQREGRGPTLLRGSLHAVDGRAVAGATVEVLGLATPRYRTDETGQWVLALPDGHATGPVTVRVTLPDGTTVDAAGVCVVKGRETSLRETALRGWVLRRGAGVAGATVTVSGQPVPAPTGADGGWFSYFRFDQPAVTVGVTATLPTGEQQSVAGVPVVPRATTTVPTFQFP